MKSLKKDFNLLRGVSKPTTVMSTDDPYPSESSIDNESDDAFEEIEAGTLEIEKQLEDVTAWEDETVLFECKVETDIVPTCIWYKNGKILQTDSRTNITKDYSWHRLEINRVKATDQGLYSIECSDNRKYISTKARLFVAPRRINDGAFYHSPNGCEVGVIKHLRNVKVTKGDKIKLEAKFIQKSEEYTWFKNDEIVDYDRRTSFLNDRLCASLTITNAKSTDTGVYFVVSKTKTGYVSSFADVEVSECNEKLQVLPIIVEYLPDEVEIFEGEEMRITMRAYTDKYTTIRWEKNRLEIKDSDIVKVDYGDCYLGLRIPKCTLKSVGEYRACLENQQPLITRVIDTSTIVTTADHQQPRAEKKIPPVVNVVRPLESAVACCGATVSFDCSFDIQDPIYFYVVWYVGHYKVERTNRLFNVVCGGSQFLLYIKNLKPSMSGEVICELRRAWPHKQSVMVKRAYARLDIVPFQIIQETKLRPVLESKLYYEHANVSVRMGDSETSPSDGYPLDSMVESLSLGVANTCNAEYFLKIVYCRLDEDCLYFLHATQGETVGTSRLFVRHKTTYKHHKSKITVIEWVDTVPSKWYGIELGQVDGSFAEVGATSQARFQVEDPPLDRIMVFRIRRVEPMSYVTDLNVYITPPPEIILRPNKPHEIQQAQAFYGKYTETNEVVGSGAFGSVLLVRDKDSNTHYAAKFVKKKIGKTEERIFREFHIMKKLRHPKLIELIDFYVLPMNQYVFVMEFCWGGELFDRIVEEDHITEVDVVTYVKQLCEGLEYIHKINIVHLDLKPENIICLSPNTRQVKLIDFGLARNVDDPNGKALYGTKDYVAPEVLDFETISTASDMWSLGVVIYMLLSGVLPFGGDSWLERCANITRANYNYDDYAFNDISSLAKEFVDLLLIRQPGRRMSATQALAHRWITEGPPKGTASGHMKTTKANLKSYLADYKARWQRAGNVMIAANRLRKRGGHETGSPGEDTPPLAT